MNKPREREIRELCRRAGFTVVELEPRAHIRATLERGGELYRAWFSSTPSCPRGDLNALCSRQLKKVLTR